MEIDDAVRQLLVLIDDRNANPVEAEDRPRFRVNRVEITGIGTREIAVAAYDPTGKRYRYGMFSDGGSRDYVCDGF